MVTFSQIQTDLLIGTLLGDGNLQTQNGQTWRYRVLHKGIQEPYVMHKYSIMQEYCDTPPKYSEVFDKRTNKSYSRYSFNTLTSDTFRFFGQLFYKNENGRWKKHVPNNIKNYLTPRALAYWYMDDGAMKWQGHSNSVRLCTDSFCESEVLCLKEALESNFELDVSLQSKNNIVRLCILEKSYPKLKELIIPFLLPCMFYKFPDGNYGVYNNENVLDDLHNRFEERDF